MSKAKPPTPIHTLYIRKFPQDVTRRLKSEAALAGLSMADYLAQLLTQSWRDLK